MAPITHHLVWKITEAIRRYGVSDLTSALFIVRIGGPEISPSRVQEGMDAVVSGTLVPINELREVTNWFTIKKVRVFGTSFK